ncbi:MAG: hypothetical protein ABEJ61_04990 [Haloferacaceae archaeon]
MTLYAVDDVDDAVAATRSFLWPVDRGRWVRLAVVVFFVDGGGGVPFQFTGGAPGGAEPSPPGGPGVPAAPDAVPSVGGADLADLAVVAALVALVGLVLLGFLLVGSVMEFVLVESLRREAVTIRRYWRERWRQGVRLFAVRLVLGVLVLGVVGLLLAAALAPLLLGTGAFSLVALLVAVPVVVVAVAIGLVDGFTTMFVVPVMVVEDRGVLAAWRRFWPTATGQWKQYAAYAVGGVVLQAAAGIAAGVVTLLAAAVLAVPFGVVALVGVGLLGVLSVAGWAVIALAALLFGLGTAVVALLVAVPVQTFLRYSGPRRKPTAKAVG